MKRPLGRPRHRWEDNIKAGLEEEIRCEGVVKIYLAWDMDQWRALVNAVINTVL
jgi:hypothetical protein